MSAIAIIQSVQRARARVRVRRSAPIRRGDHVTIHVPGLQVRELTESQLNSTVDLASGDMGVVVSTPKLLSTDLSNPDWIFRVRLDRGGEATVTWSMLQPVAEAATEPAATEGAATSSEETGVEPSPTKQNRHPGLRRLGRALALALNALLVVVVGFTVFVAYGTVNNRWYHVVAIEGGSMEPTIGVGDLAVIVPPPDRVEVGMIVTMEVEGKVVTHRVVEVHPDGTFVTKGDANTVRDDFSGLNIRVVGRVVFTIPKIGGFLAGGHGAPVLPSPAPSLAPAGS